MSQTTAQMRIGATLHNGARVLDFTNYKVLAFAPDESPFHPFVIWTWEIVNNEIVAYSGNYFTNIAAAVAEWSK